MRCGKPTGKLVVWPRHFSRVELGYEVFFETRLPLSLMSGGPIAIVALISFVIAHEAGHFFAAKATGMKVTEFFIGFGPKIFSFKRGETEYGLKPIPIGAYVRVVGMNALEEVDPADYGRTYREKPFWAKSVVVLAGVTANFLLAFMLFTGAYLANGRNVIVDGSAVPTLSISGISETIDGTPSAASSAGILEGDLLVAFNGEELEDWEGLASAIRSTAIGDEFEVEVLRDGERVELSGTMGSVLDPETGKPRPLLGIVPNYLTESLSVFEASGLAGQDMWESAKGAIGFLGRLVSPDSILSIVQGMGGGEVPDDVRPVSPIGVYQMANGIEGVDLLAFLAFINMVLGTLNILPLFPLDGGHFALALYEKLRGRPADVRKLIPVATAVMLFIGFLFVASITLDLVDPISQRFS